MKNAALFGTKSPKTDTKTIFAMLIVFLFLVPGTIINYGVESNSKQRPYMSSYKRLSSRKANT